MSEKILSICISTYNRCDKCTQLIQSICTLKDNRYNVVVCDDASSDGTAGALRKLSYDNLVIKENKRNLGPCRNWYNTINSGTAKYVLHVLDRDTLNILQLQYLLDLLEEYDISGGYIGLSAIDASKDRQIGKSAYLYKKGKEAFLYMGGVPIHPTGFIVLWETWERCRHQIKRYFYLTEKYGIYPHSYVMAHMALRGDMLYIPADFYFYKYIGKNSESRFYQFYKGKRNFWWLPENVLETAVKLLFYLYPYAGWDYQKDLIIRRFGDGLYRATKSYKDTAADKAEMAHYGVKERSISDIELLVTGIWYYSQFMKVEKKFCIDNDKKTKCALRRKWRGIMSEVLRNKG